MQTGQVAAAAHLAAAGLGLVCQLVAFTRQDWSPLAQAFLEVLEAQPWERRPRSATIVE